MGTFKTLAFILIYLVITGNRSLEPLLAGLFAQITVGNSDLI